MITGERIIDEGAPVLDKVWGDILRQNHERALDRARGRDFLATCTTRSQLLASASVIGFAAHAYGHAR
jgi:hypothetical protein